MINFSNILPKHILEGKDLSEGTKSVLAVILTKYRASSEKYVAMTNAELAAVAGVDADEIPWCQSQLICFGLISKRVETRASGKPITVYNVNFENLIKPLPTFEEIFANEIQSVTYTDDAERTALAERLFKAAASQS